MAFGGVFRCTVGLRDKYGKLKPGQYPFNSSLCKFYTRLPMTSGLILDSKIKPLFFLCPVLLYHKVAAEYLKPQQPNSATPVRVHCSPRGPKGPFCK